jgi:hypothetical protein
MVRPFCRMIVLTLILFAFLLPVDQVSACSCAEPLSPKEAVAQAQAVFTGVVTNREESPDQDPSSFDRRRRRYRFTVTGVLKGEVGTTIDVSTGLGGGDCGYYFELGHEYLVYAFGSPKALSTSICSRTKIMEPPSQVQEEIEELKGTP